MMDRRLLGARQPSGVGPQSSIAAATLELHWPDDPSFAACEKDR